jgi:hypothetical protein
MQLSRVSLWVSRAHLPIDFDIELTLNRFFRRHVSAAWALRFDTELPFGSDFTEAIRPDLAAAYEYRAVIYDKLGKSSKAARDRKRAKELKRR